MAVTPPKRERQIEFPPLQTHDKRFEMAMLAISIACAIIVLIIVLFTGLGNEFRPTAGSTRPRCSARSGAGAWTAGRWCCSWGCSC
jgi:hypothetical protein